jgi:hypothetical protein
VYFLLNSINEISENLFMGEPPTSDEVVEYRYIICLNGKPTYYTPHHTFVVSYPFDDVEQMPPENDIQELARMAAQFSKLGPTLIHCSAGFNRSGLVAALTLMYLGRTAKQAIAQLRLKRCDSVLSNNTFREWLLSTEILKND